FTGANKINDEVLRREMRQLEGAWLSNVSVERSKQRVQRLPYVKKVETETTPVPGSPDLVDVVFQVEEGPSAQLGGGIGYSESQSFILSGNYADSNFMGTGERIAIDLNSGRYQKVYGLSHTDPYTTIDGVARTTSVTYRDVTQFVSASSDFSSETITAGLSYGYPITEFQSVQLGVALQSAELLTSELGSAQQAIDWVRSNGNAFEREEEFINFDGSIGTVRFFGTKFKTAELIGGWSFDTRNRALFATRGTRHSLSLAYAVPGGEVEYWVANYEYLQYVPLGSRFALSFNAELGYGADIGDTTSMPPFRQFFGGGPDTVRGYRESRLGPKDNFGNPYGGNLKVVGRTELILPMPEKWQSMSRFSAFFDIGNVFSTGHVDFFGRDAIPGVPNSGTPIDYDFSYDDLKQSAGIAVQWLAPLGIFRFSYAFPLNPEKSDGIRFEDELERFQFSIGQAF
ncbi:MAG: outer membrane protein assembly factor BamA, partial [Steroidobacteraceae bacterium]